MTSQIVSYQIASIVIVTALVPAVLGQSLVVGTKHSPPFAFKNPDGQWTGISIELWKQLAAELNLKYELRELTLDDMLSSLEAGKLDAAVAAISVTAERHQRVDFCHPHFTTGLGIAVMLVTVSNSWYGRRGSPSHHRWSR